MEMMGSLPLPGSSGHGHDDHDDHSAGEEEAHSARHALSSGPPAMGGVTQRRLLGGGEDGHPYPIGGGSSPSCYPWVLRGRQGP